jgi:hypothetical protein
MDKQQSTTEGPMCKAQDSTIWVTPTKQGLAHDIYNPTQSNLNDLWGIGA